MPEATGELSKGELRPEGITQARPEVEVPPQETRERTDEQAARRQEASKIAEVGSELASHVAQQDFKPVRNPLFGDFQNVQLSPDGKIMLPAADMDSLREPIAVHKSNSRFSLPIGYSPAAEYKSKVKHFSTRTAIVPMEDGRKVFAVYNYPLSPIHRWLDTKSMRLAGDKVRKVSSAEWKSTFEERSNIPIIENDDPDVVLMPYIPNVNAYDLLANNHDIGNFGPHQWADDIDLEGKLTIGEQIIGELDRIHQTGRSWGQAILPNMVVIEGRKPVIVDPETLYDEGVPPEEQRARDLRDALFSITGALHKSEGFTDYGSAIKRMLGRYSDQDKTIDQLKNLVSQKPTFVQKIMNRVYETVRIGTKPSEFPKVSRAILDYTPEIKQGDPLQVAKQGPE